MVFVNQLRVRSRTEFRVWLAEHAATETECWVSVKRGKPTDDAHFWYVDAVEEALCFGWIDSVWKRDGGEMWSRFSPRKKKSPWTELNKERVRRLEQLGRMTDAGRAVLPDMEYVPDADVERDIREAGLWETFSAFPPLYQRVRGYNLAFAKRQSDAAYRKAFAHFEVQTRAGKTYGEWNDYGRLLS